MMSFEKSLAVMRDVPGVEGTFVLDDTGGLLACDASFALPETVLASAAARIGTLLETASEAFEPTREITLVFASHRLVLRSLAPYVLAVLARTGSPTEALRMASNIALRHMVRQLTGGGEPSVPSLRAAVPGGGPSSSRILVAAGGPASSPRQMVSPARAATPKEVATPKMAPPAPKKKPKSDIWG